MKRVKGVPSKVKYFLGTPTYDSENGSRRVSSDMFEC